MSWPLNLLNVENTYEQVDFEPILAYAQLAAPIFKAYQQYNCVQSLTIKQFN